MVKGWGTLAGRLPSVKAERKNFHSCLYRLSGKHVPRPAKTDSQILPQGTLNLWREQGPWPVAQPSFMAVAEMESLELWWEGAGNSLPK